MRWYVPARVLRLLLVLIFIVKTLGLTSNALIIVAAQNGLGKSIPLVQPSQRGPLAEMLFAASLTAIASIALVKASVALLISNILQMEYHRRICRWFCVTIAAWLAVAFLANSLACGPSTPWLRQTFDMQCFENVSKLVLDSRYSFG